MKSKILLFIFFICMLTLGLWARQGGEHRYLSSRSLAVIYKYLEESEPEEGEPEEGEPSPTIIGEFTETHISEIKGKMAELREFYWRNSNFILNIEVEVYVIEEPLTFDDLAIVFNEYAIDVEKVFADVISAGKNLAENGTIFGIWPCDRYTGSPTAGNLAWAYHVLNGRPGVINLSSIKCFTFHTYLHEYHHAIASMLNAPGFPDFPLTHFNEYQASGNTSGEGIFWEFFASTTRNYPVENWFEQSTWKWGNILFTDDADNDGLPDNGFDLLDNPLAITENNLFSSALTPDTDGDYLTDFEEATAHFLRGSDPVNDIDSDDDGFIDGEDIYPLLPKSFQISCSSPPIDGNIDPGEHSLVSTRTGSASSIDSYIDFDINNLYFSFHTYTDPLFSMPNNFSIYFDMNCDGILNGNDNYQVKILHFLTTDSLNMSINRVKGDTYEIIAGETIDPSGSIARLTYTKDTINSTYDYKLTLPLSDLFGTTIQEGLQLNMLVYYKGLIPSYNVLRGETAAMVYSTFTKVVLSNSTVTNMEFSADTIDFGTIDETESAEKTIRIRNFGERDLHISRVISLRGDLSTNQLPATLSPRASADLTITYNPSGPGPFVGLIIIESDATNGTGQAIACFGQVTERIPITDIFQAEDGEWNNAEEENEHAGYTGTGYVNTDNETGVRVEWTVTMSQSETTDFEFYFANGSSNDRTMELKVNGNVIFSSISFVNTGGWSNWWRTTISYVPLQPGDNVIRLTANTSDGAPNLDKLEITY